METSAICPCGHVDAVHGPQGCEGGRYRPCPCRTFVDVDAPAMESHTIVPADWAYRHDGDGNHFRVR